MYYFPYPVVSSTYSWGNAFGQPQYIPAYPSPAIIQQAADANYLHQVEAVAQQQSMQMDLEQLAQKYELELKKEEAKKRLEVSADDEKQMHNSDIKDLSEMHTRAVELTSDGKILYSKEGFRSKSELKVPFTIPDALVLRCVKDNRKVLALGYKMEKRCGGIYLWTDRLDDRMISRKFNAAGLTCGLSRAREMDFRRCLIQKCILTAEEKWIPERHGWYMCEEELWFAFPEELTWEEVTYYAGE